MIFISILTLIVAKALPYFTNNLSSIYFTRISAIIFIYAGLLSFNTLYIQSIGSGIGIYSGLFNITQVSTIIEVFILIIASLILIAWPLSAAVKPATDYSLIVLFSTLGSLLLISSSDLISMYLSIELQSFGLYVLSTLYRDSESSTSAGLKYFLLGGLSSCLILLGAGLIYAYTGLTNFESIYSLISVSSLNGSAHLCIQGFSLGLILIIIGFLFKISAAPLHNWSPDVYDDTPTIVTIWLTIMPKIAILILLLELYTQIGFIGGGLVHYIASDPAMPLPLSTPAALLEVSAYGIYLIKNLLLISSLLSLIIGTVVGLAQTRIKRLLAYSTISHIGFILLALAINTEQSIDSLIFYIIQYSITNLNVFLIIIALGYIMAAAKGGGGSSSKTHLCGRTSAGSLGDSNAEGGTSAPQGTDIKFISDIKGQFFLNPILSLSLAICLFSMAGIPPLIGFFSKQFVLYSALQSGYNFISIVAILVSVISASYYLKIIKVIYSEGGASAPALPGSENNQSPAHKCGASETTQANPEIILTNFHSFLISTLTLSILLFILKPSLILNSTQLLSLSLFNL